jgi:hypothetical protein
MDLKSMPKEVEEQLKERQFMQADQMDAECGAHR